MPAPRKVDLLPEELRRRLQKALADRGFANIVEVTEDLNFWLEEEGLDLRLGKSAVGEFSKILKDQRDAFDLARTVLADLDIDAESDMHRTLMHMIGATAVQYLRSLREDDKTPDAKELRHLSSMLRDLMASAGQRDKNVADEEKRFEERGAKRERAEQAAKLKAAEAAGDIDAAAAEKARAILGFSA